ncbi:MAG: hypothetical protein U9Q83_11050 [Bacteroidota bacterium]|nr:hypothetical protein [Bacteroidota bacterium]
MNTPPILFLVFNRPENTKKVFSAIRDAKPEKLFLAADGPRKDVPEDKEKCRITRNIATDVDWDCELKTLIRDKNLGCGLAVSSAITWFFENVEEGIILEDDCLPSQSFFSFCEIMLEKFRNDERIMMVTGFNQFGEWNSDKYDYFFSRGGIWGWATWKRAWRHFSMEIPDINSEDCKYALKSVYPDSKIFKMRYKQIYNASKKQNVWGYLWIYARVMNNGLSVTSSRNLIKNIGFGDGATHTTGTPSSMPRLYKHTFPLRHNNFIVMDEFYENILEKQLYKINKRSNISLWVEKIFGLKIKNIIKNIINKTDKYT